MTFYAEHTHNHHRKAHGKGRRHLSHEHPHRGHDRHDHQSDFGPRGGGARRPHRGPDGFGPRGHGKRARRGNIRFAIVSMLADGPQNGFGLIKQIEERTGGTWKPSSGTIYPSLQRLVDEGLIQLASEGEGNTYALTDAGQQFLNENKAEIDAAWQQTEQRADGSREMTDAVQRFMFAAHEVRAVATPEQRDRAVEIVNSARKALYGILAE